MTDIEQAQHRIGLLEEENKRLRVRIAFMNADLVRMDILKDEADSLKKAHDKMRKENHSLYTINNNLKKKLAKLEGKNEKQDSAEAGSDDRAGDTVGSC